MDRECNALETRTGRWMDMVTRLESDVLVIGGGGAALVAAIAAAEGGAKVALASKGPVGLLSCTAYAGGGFTAAVEGFTPARHRELTMEIGRGVNDPDLVHILSEEGAGALSWLEERGVALAYRRGGASMAGPSLGKLVKGTAMTMPLVDRCRELGVEFHHPVRVHTLLQEDFGGRVFGARGDARRGEVEFRSGAVILATGGGAWTFSHTDNPRGLTGDGYLMGFAAGCSLRDMEFVQFYPLGPGPDVERTWYMDARILDRVRLTDGHGRDFLTPLLAEWGLSSGREINMLARDRLSRAIAQKRVETGRVLLHLEDLPPEDRRDARMAHRARLMAGPDPRDPWMPVEVAPVSHFMSGGLVVDSRGETGIDGLFACGEVTGGVHGANRVGGNALTELTVFGIRAGKGAAEASELRRDADPSAYLPPIAGIDLSEHTQGRHLGEANFRKRAYELVGPLRTPESMGEMLGMTAGSLAEMGHHRDASGDDALHWTAAAVALAGLAREESRGTHYRTDSPGEVDGQRGSYRLIPRRDGDLLVPRLEFVAAGEI